MEALAANLLTLLKKPAASSDAKVKELNQLKSDIKHYRVPDAAVSTIFECIKIAITQQASSTLASTAFSTLGHLLKRLKIQDASGHAITQLAPRLFPALQDRLGDLREPVRAAASQALTDLYTYCSGDVEHIIQEEAIGSSNARAKETGMRWVLKMHKEEGMPFKAYVAPIVARLEDADGNVREAAKSVLVELFATAPERAKLDLKRQLKAHSVRHSIVTQILQQLGSDTGSRPQSSDRPEPAAELTGSTRSLPTIDHAAHLAESISSEAAQPPPQEIVPMDPVYVHTQRELEDIFRDMSPHFEGKETEQNWVPRDKSIMKLRRILKGNAPTEFHTAFMAGLKAMIEGIIKVASSLRTTMATNGCQLVQELARTLGPTLDPHVEMFLQTFIKMSANRKHIAAENGRVTADSIFQNCSYNARMVQHIWMTAQEKNPEQRQCTPSWLSTIMKRQASYKHNFESSGGLELAEKCIKKGLDDANPKVKEGYRAAYWTFAKSWPDRAQGIMTKLDPKSKTALEKDPNNPNAARLASHSGSAASSRATGAASRNTLRELMAEQRKAKAIGVVPRPNSAMADISPTKSRQPAASSTRPPSNLSKVTNRNASTTSNASTVAEPPGSAVTAKKGSSLMSGPVRRPRRPEPPRPQTADPYASRRMLRPETPANDTPSGSPFKGTGNSKASMASSINGRNGAKSGIPTASPGSSPAKRSPGLTRGRPQHDLGSRPTSKGSTGTNGDTVTSVREDDLTMVMPKASVTATRGAFSPGHKRPGLGQTMSVDSGRSAIMEDEDGFTMVMPELASNQSRAGSPLAYRSPIKAMLDEAREKIGKLSPEAEKHMRINSHGEQEGGPIKVSLPPTVASQTDEMQIYEDPFVEDENRSVAPEERKVLGELPVNENVCLNSPTQSTHSGNSPAGSPRQAPDPRMPTISVTQDRSEVMRNKKLLISGIERIRTKALDAHGFRKVQDVVKSKTDIWDGGKKYDELMTVSLEYLQTFDQETKLMQQPQKAVGLKAQALGLVRALLTIYRKDAMAWHAKALVTVLSCRKGVDSSTHLLTDMQRTADDIIQEASPEGCIDAVLDFIPPPSDEVAAARAVAMALAILRQCVMNAKTKELDLGAERKGRLAQTAARYLNDADSDVRKVDVDLASELFEVFGPSKTEFWSEFKGVDEGRLGLLTYYIAKKGKGVAAATAATAIQ